jgi:spore cortex formation protein SpoVR/YcgB (stage V sporulation)
MLLFDSSEWNFETIERIYDACEEEARILKLDWYPNQLEIINSEQMVDAYSSIGLPVMYHHWSFGKHFSQTWNSYQKGYQGLAYEIVINSNPCISYLMEQNSSTMQALVIAHAAFGHNHFFKNNYLFKTWTDAESITDYLIFAKNYIEEMERKEGKDVVEEFLNSCHALMNYGVNRYKKPRKLRVDEEKKRKKDREDYEQSRVDELYRLYAKPEEKDDKEESEYLKEPEENILYFCEKHAFKLKPWQRECIRIVRKLAAYFYPQPLTKVMNEGCASFVHYKIMTAMHEKGKISDGHYLEFLSSHANVLYQPDFSSKRYNGLNPYKLGFEIFRDIERICLNPTEEDKYWSPDICNQDPKDVFLDVVANYRDESFVQQFLSPKVIRDMRLFRLVDDTDRSFYNIKSIHNEDGYRDIRETLARQYEREAYIPKIEVIARNKYTRTMTLRYTEHLGRKLKSVDEVMHHVRNLWGDHVVLTNENGMTTEKVDTPDLYGGAYYV